MTFAAAVPDPQGRQLDQIRLDGVTATGHHGVLPHERAEGQVFSADVVLHLDTRAAASADDLGATVSYADVARDVHDVLAGSPADLVETVAERIAAVVLARDAVHTVDVRVHKPQAPIEVPFDDVAVVVRRDRSHAPAVDAPAPPAAPTPAPEPEPAAAPALGAAAATAAAAVPPPEPGSAPAPVPPMPAPAEPAQPMPAAAEPAQPMPAAAEPAEPAVDPLDVVPAEPVEAVLALGANLGDAQVTLREAVTDIDRLAGVQVTDVSPLARTAAVGGPEQPDYLNAVLVVRTTLSAAGLLDALQDVEEHHGRVREERWGPRTLDVDIVQYGALTSADSDLELPHPRAHERAFVLVPWAEIAPDAVLGGLGGGIVGQLAATAPDRAGIRWLALDWLTGPTQSTGQVGASPSAPAPSAPVPQAPDAVEEAEPRPETGARPAADEAPQAAPAAPWTAPEDRAAPELPGEAWPGAPEAPSEAVPAAPEEAWPAPDALPEVRPEAPAEPGPAPSPGLPVRRPAAEQPAPEAFPAAGTPEAYAAPATPPGGEHRPVPDPWPAPQAPQEPSEPEPQGVVPQPPAAPDVPDPAALPPVPGPDLDVPTAPERPADATPAARPASGIIDSVPQASPATPTPHAPVPPAPDVAPAPPDEPEALRPYAAGPAEPRPATPPEPWPAPAEPAGDTHRPVPAESHPPVPAESHPPVPPAPPETYPPFGGEPAQVNPFAPFGEPDPEPRARPDEPGTDTDDERER